MVNRAFDTAYNRKRIRRVMEINDWNLPRPGRRRSGRAHTGRIVRGSSNERWCSDTLQIPCWNGELVELGFILDCHDREAIAHVAVPRKSRASDVKELLETAVARRFRASQPVEGVQFLSDNGTLHCTAAQLSPHLAPFVVIHTTGSHRPCDNYPDTGGFEPRRLRATRPETKTCSLAMCPPNQQQPNRCTVTALAYLALPRSQDFRIHPQLAGHVCTLRSPADARRTASTLNSRLNRRRFLLIEHLLPEFIQSYFGVHLSLHRFDGRVNDRTYAATCNCCSYSAGLA